ncbi:acyl-CoA dehydrogenase family protein [Microbispora sp. ATCC PTA-5024]|uniref:acyl-CoA dehydrogenase family protein n=1 Tax=Microbispora sp. ATCC PTA-5024 TaxID=316330 RepID=UPI0003DCDC9E|nr:acyl-CoA dehydrogenase family protein [Microbispora sp. ATCC PTA-5024]ETK37055.1 acyl-CoA dehydrogenase [Microbispora sp. ATCC PTA-5024]
MRFVLDAEQRMFGETVDAVLSRSGRPGTIRAWAAGTTAPGLALWRALAEAGVPALAVPPRHGGAGPLPVELVTAFHELGRHAAPGPYVETVAAAVLLDALGDAGPAAQWLPRVADGTAVVTLALAPAVPYALDADTADLTLAVDGDRLCRGEPGAPLASLDPARRLFPVAAGTVLASGPAVRAAAARAYDLGALACAAQLAGLGHRLLEATVAHARSRRQFGRPIGEFQAVKHRLADVLVGLEYARPLVHGAALTYGAASFPRDVSAAKAAASDAAYAAARAALQIHGAMGYTDEYDLSLWIRKATALRQAWGGPAGHRARVLAALSSTSG